MRMIRNDSPVTMEAGPLTGYGDTDDAMGGPKKSVRTRYINRIQDPIT